MTDAAPERPTNTLKRAAAWDAFALGLRRDAAVWLAVMVFLSAWRCFMAWPALKSLDLADVGRSLWTGIRFDSVIASIVILPTVVLGWLISLSRGTPDLRRLRALLVTLFLLVTAFTYVANYHFHETFGTQLDQRVLAAFEGYDGELSATIWQAYHPIRNILLALCLGLAASALTLSLARRIPAGWPQGVRHPAHRLILTLICIALMVGLIRGFSWGVSPIRIHNAHVSASTTMNRLIPSPYAFFLLALEERNRGATTPSAAELTQALAVHERASGMTPEAGSDLNERLTRHTSGAKAPARHIFVILMEGQHGFPLLPKYRSWGFYPNLSELADKGAWFANFVPSGRQTDNTVGAVVGGTLTPDFVVLTEPNAHKELPTSLPAHFSRLGFFTRFYYSGAAGWERLDEFILPQGFRELRTVGEMPGRPGNAWGVWDGELYDHVLATVDPARPSLNVILTTTNHSPFDADDSILPPLPPLPGAAATWSEPTLRVLRHEMYADREVGRFVREAERRFPHSLFVITGDHTAYAAHYSLPDANELDLMTVPLILYGDALPEGLRHTFMRPAAHLDIAPTLYNLTAPAGFAYHALGNDLFAPGGAAEALGQDRVLLDGWLASASGMDVWALEGQPPSDAPLAQLDLARQHHAAALVISRAMIYGTSGATGN